MILKELVTTAVSMGVGQVVTNIVDFTTPKNINTFRKITTNIGGFAIGLVISKLSVEYVEEQIDNVIDSYNEFVNKDEVEDNDKK